MKIISKYKDYYDYLSAIYGEDPLKVLDRRNVNPSENITEIYFCGKLYIKGNPKHVMIDKRNGGLRYADREDKYYITDYYHIDVVYKDDNVVWFTLSWEDYMKRKRGKKEDYIDKSKAYHDLRKPLQYPLLKNIGFEKVMDAQECYLTIENYISKQDVEVPSDPTDMNRYESKGFDKKTSFRV